MNKEISITAKNKMGTQPVGKVMLSMGIPMILSMMLQAVYNIVDSAFVANMPGTGEAALNALTLAFPVQMLMVAISIGTGVGVNALLSKSLGQNDTERASRTAGNAIFLGAVICIIFVLFGIFGVNAYISSQSENSQIITMASEYLEICCIWSFGIVYFAVFEKILQASGKSLYSTIAQIIGALINVILDPILIYGLIGFPQMGVKGAAIATVIGQIASFIAAAAFHFITGHEIKFRIKYILPSKRIICGIYSIGLPAIIAQALMSLMTYLLNIILIDAGENAVTTYGLYYKIQQFILFAAFGLRDAVTPIVSFNHGMGSKKRVLDGIKYGMFYTLAIMLFGFILLEVTAVPLTSLFDLTGETAELCISAIRIISTSFVFAGANIAFQGIFQALDSGIESLIISVCRQFLFIIPTAWLFCRLAVSYSLDASVIWIAFPAAEILSLFVAVLLMKRVSKNRIGVMSE